MVSPEFELLLTDRLQALETALTAAQAEMLTDCRGAAITALQGVIGFVAAIPRLESQNLTLPLTVLMAALHDLDTGRVGAIFRPRRAPELRNRHPDASFRSVIKALAIFFVDELHGHGMPVDEACKFVAAELGHSEVSVGGRTGTPSWKTVRTWRRDVSRRRDDDGQPDLLLRTLAGLREYPFAPSMSLEQIKMELPKLIRERLPRLAGLG